jgi:putative ABC transport system permease protein
MSLWRQLRAGWRVLLRRAEADQGIQRELEHFREELAKSLEAKGMPEEEARRMAGAEVGSLLAARERVRDGGWEAWVSGWIDDVRYAARRLRRNPGFTLAAVLTLGLGLGAVAAIFAVIDGVLLKPLPYPHAGRVVALWHTAPGIQLGQLAMSDSFYFTYREEGKAFEDVALWNGNWATVTELGAPEQEPALFVSHTFLDVLGVKPAMGRSFEAQDVVVNGARTVILADGYWKKKFGGARGVLGKRIILDGNAHEVIGVLPPEFGFMDERISMLVPRQTERGRTLLLGFGIRGIARLRPGVTIEEANADAARCIRMAPSKFPANPGMPANSLETARIAPTFRSLRDDQLGNVSESLWVLLAAVGVLFVLACANVGNLILVRAEARQREISVRRALGAGWGRTARDIVVETLLLSVLGALSGLAMAWGAIEWLRHFGVTNLPRVDNVSVDGRTMAMALLCALAAGTAIGLGTVWAALRRSSWDGMRPSAPKQRILLVAQVALAMVLLAASGLVLRSYLALRDVDPGFQNPEQVLAVRISIPRTMAANAEARLRLFQAAVRGFQSVPGVEAVSVVTSIPMEGGPANPWQIEGHPEREGASAKVRGGKYVSPGYVDSIRSRLVAGRDFEWRDIEGMAPVVMISENMARELWGTAQAAIGKKMRELSRGDWREIVGVAGDLRNDGVAREAPSIVYVPLAERNLDGGMSVPGNVDYLIRSRRTGSALFVEELRRALEKVNANLPLARVRTLDEVYRRSMARTALTLALMGVAGGMALLLGVVGIYGVVAYAVARRRKDIGIRMALGASGASVAVLFLRDGLRMACIGATLGLAAALGLTRLMTAVLFGVSPADPLTYAAVALVLVSAAALASWWPARRAAAVNPIEALRAD